MSVATLRHNSTLITNHTSSSSSSSGQISSRSGSSGELLHTQLQQGGGGGHSTTAIAPSTHGQATGIWDLANSTDMSYELAAAGTGKNLDHFFIDSIFEFE